MAGRIYTTKLLLTTAIVLVLTHGINCVSHALTASPQYDEIYADAMRAYNKKDWKEAVKLYEEAIADWKRERTVTTKCRRGCKEVYEKDTESRIGNVPMDYLFYINHMRNCSKACITGHMGVRFPVSKSVRQIFDQREPFTFLQYSYHKVGMNKMAARAATTFLRFFPNDEIVNGNLEFYQTMPELKGFDVDVSLEPILHHELYEKGRLAYNAKDWDKTVEYFEEALVEYMIAYKECQTNCEIEMENHHQHYSGGVYAYHMQLLFCRLDCPRKLSMRYRYPQVGYLSKHYDFLQYSYGQLERYDEAVKCAATFQLFDPISTHMYQNVEYYKEKELTEANINPREEGLYIYNDIWSQMRLLRDVKSYLFELDAEYKGTENLQDTTYERFMAKGLFPDESLERTEELEKEVEEGGEGNAKKDTADEETYKKFPLPTKENIETFFKSHKDYQGVTVTMMEEQLNGSYRAVFDGVITEEECKILMDIGLAIGHPGDGYKNNPSPHTVKEEFLGVNINNATWAAAKGEISLEAAELYMNLSEKVRLVTEAYFGLPTPLYFSYTHLVCRKAFSDQNDKGLHISHPLHSDNCVLRGDDVLTCVKESPAYTWRDYSALLYLNDDFVGGQFVFAAPNKTVQAIVRPQCGRVVVFSAGFENLHGVLGIKEGTRCALPIWFTLDKKHIENQRKDAAAVLKKLRFEKKTNNSNEHKEL